jgi:hypothetical protein
MGRSKTPMGRLAQSTGFNPADACTAFLGPPRHMPRRSSTGCPARATSRRPRHATSGRAKIAWPRPCVYSVSNPARFPGHVATWHQTTTVLYQSRAQHIAGRCFEAHPGARPGHRFRYSDRGRALAGRPAAASVGIGAAGSPIEKRRCPLYPRKRTCAVQLGMPLRAKSGHRQHLFNDLICSGKERRRHSEAERLRSLEVDR